VGPPWVQLKIGYYVYALLFVLFDVETAFLYPWAVTLNVLPVYVLAEMVVFLAILFLGLVYAWKEGALSWR
jgi:NADH-quinone oxidoreductase subunit A